MVLFGGGGGRGGPYNYKTCYLTPATPMCMGEVGRRGERGLGQSLPPTPNLDNNPSTKYISSVLNNFIKKRHIDRNDSGIRTSEVEKY